jgi:hypothetical protein
LIASAERDAESNRQRSLKRAFSWTQRHGWRLDTAHYLETLMERPYLTAEDRAALLAYRETVIWKEQAAGRHELVFMVRRQLDWIMQILFDAELGRASIGPLLRERTRELVEFVDTWLDEHEA